MAATRNTVEMPTPSKRDAEPAEGPTTRVPEPADLPQMARVVLEGFRPTPVTQFCRPWSLEYPEDAYDSHLAMCRTDFVYRRVRVAVGADGTVEGALSWSEPRDASPPACESVRPGLSVIDDLRQPTCRLWTEACTKSEAPLSGRGLFHSRSRESVPNSEMVLTHPAAKPPTWSSSDWPSTPKVRPEATAVD
jgi:hypothetical protein